MKNYYRIGITNEGQLLLNNRNTFYGVVIGGNFAALYKNWLSTFLKKLKKPFFLDPRTEVFGRNLDQIRKKGDFRASFDKLINYFDTTAGNTYFSDTLKRGKLSPDAFMQSSDSKQWNTKLINIMVNGTLSLQNDVLNLDATSNKQSIKKYLKILNELPIEDDPHTNVEYLVAPYFYSPNTFHPWFKINVKLLNTTVQNAKKDVYCILCFDKEVLGNNVEIENIIKSYTKAKGFLLWINNHYEIKADSDDLQDYYNFIKKLKATGKSVFNLFGGYFTLLSSKYVGPDGYCRGIGLGDGRDVDMPATGGGIPNRYYLRLTHNFSVEETIIQVLGRNPQLRCTCNICKPLVTQVIKELKPHNNMQLAMNFIKQLPPQMYKAHFMQVHNMEIKHIKGNIDVKGELKNEINEANSRRLRELDVKTSHLDRWLEALPK